MFYRNSFVSFINNTALYGGAIHNRDYSNVMFYRNSFVSFINNTARYGGAVRNRDYSNVMFYRNSFVSFINNTAEYGGAIYSRELSNISVDGNASIYFNNNSAEQYGGAIRLYSNAAISFGGSSMATFIDNSAKYGGAIAGYMSIASFNGESMITFDHNIAEQDGGAMYCVVNSITPFYENSSVQFYNNRAANHGGAIHIFDYSRVTFHENSFVSFTNNTANYGGAVNAHTNCTVSFDDFSITTFIDNIAKGNGGALYGAHYSNIPVIRNSTIIFQKNKATTGEGGAVHCDDHSNLLFNDNSNVTFSDNSAVGGGGAVDTRDTSKLLITGSSLLTFTTNGAFVGGAIQCTIQSSIIFDGNTLVKFTDNTADRNGGALHLNSQGTLNISRNILIIFHDNKALQGGGAIYSYGNSNITINHQSEVVLSGNSATEYGGGAHCEGQSVVTLEGNASVTLVNNTAKQGGAVYISQSSINFGPGSFVNFTSNIASDGGAMYLTNNFMAVFSYGSHVAFINNIADRYGGTLLVELTEHGNSSNMMLNTTDIDISNNTAFVGNFIHVHIPSSCDEDCVTNSIIMDTNTTSLRQRQFGKLITTTPIKLVLHDPASCTNDDGGGTNCQTYVVKNIMLGQEIKLEARVLDYYNKSAVSTQFLISTDDQDHYIAGSYYKYVSISCEIIQGISVTGDEVMKAENFSINFSSHFESQLELKTISVQLNIQLLQFHPGFHHDNKTQRCICYSDNDIISCIDSTSFIKEDYWFGVVDGKTTVTICPNSYCNFTCCKTTNEFYQLSPVRINQCLSHRSGIACGSCEEGYTLSFDSIVCVSVDKCTTGLTSLVVTLSMIYWIVIVILVFIMTYYHAGIGYLYAITYYYSVVDILLSEYLYISTGLFTTVSIMSSIAKITPQFLGQLCFVKNLSGIDQQFIHYAHPLAVTFIVGIICLLARLSYRISAFVSRGIIHVICYLLLLSYTSVATTSLLLLRSLTFHNVDKVYTFLSPDIEYFRGRHLPYAIIAILCTLVIAVGLPLLLLLEPFLNSKVNFTRIKPLLDQFQGCYIDKYRSFAGYYMTCRLVIILIIITNSSNDNTTQYLLIIVNVTLALIQVTLRPYSSTILNIFDGLILQLLILVSMIPLIDSFDPDLLLTFTIILVILPLVVFVMMEIYLYKSKIKKITEYCRPPKPDNTNDNNEIPMRDFVDSVIDDTSRRNAYICEM